MKMGPLAVVRACLQAYLDRDREAIEPLIADDYQFLSPLDNALDRKTYFDVCWPNCGFMRHFEYIYEVEDGDRVFITYEGHTDTGRAFRNSEVHLVRDGQLVVTEVYFGWDLPHRAPKGTHIENA